MTAPQRRYVLAIARILQLSTFAKSYDTVMMQLYIKKYTLGIIKENFLLCMPHEPNYEKISLAFHENEIFYFLRCLATGAGVCTQKQKDSVTNSV